MRAWLLSCGFDLQAIQSSRTPKMVYSTDAAWCVAFREIRLGSTYPSAVEIICRMWRLFSLLSLEKQQVPVTMHALSARSSETNLIGWSQR